MRRHASPGNIGVSQMARRWLIHVYNEPVSGRDEVKPAAPGVKLTYEDFLLFPDDGKRHEIIDGEHYVTATPNVKHQTIVMNLGAMIWNYLKQRPVGRAFFVPMDIVLSDYDVVEPDLQFISSARQAILYQAKRAWCTRPGGRSAFAVHSEARRNDQAEAL